jgi:hypothetical protein
MMPQGLVSLDHPPGAGDLSSVICKPVGERRFAPWLDDEFLGHAIARVDGMGTGETPCDQTFPGRVDRDAARLPLLVLHRPSFDDSAFDSSAGSPHTTGQAA